MATPVKIPDFVAKVIGSDQEVYAAYVQLSMSKKKGGEGLAADKAFEAVKARFGPRATPGMVGGAPPPPPPPATSSGTGAAPPATPVKTEAKPKTPPRPEAKPDPVKEEGEDRSNPIVGTGNPLSQVKELTPTRQSDLDAVARKSISPLEGALRMIEGLTYDGYDPAAVRALMRETLTWGDLLQVLGIYIRVGNNAGKRLGGKVKNKGVALEARALIQEQKIKPKASDSDTLTLPRMAQAVAPVTLALRRAAAARDLLDSRTETTSPIEYQDVCFNGIYAEADDYAIKFGRVLGRAAALSSKQAYDEAVTDARNKGFAEVARAGLKRDVDLQMVLHVTDLEELREWFGGA